ncbi:MAG: hypothetical protein K2Y25_09265 [Pseudomonadaceae bacterium]|nr:hypothetical protein [Pseudomonadaceae bacterium]
MDSFSAWDASLIALMALVAIASFMSILSGQRQLKRDLRWLREQEPRVVQRDFEAEAGDEGQRWPQIDIGTDDGEGFDINLQLYGQLRTTARADIVAAINQWVAATRHVESSHMLYQFTASNGLRIECRVKR